MRLTYQDPAAYVVLHARARRQLGDAAVAEARTLSVDQAADLARASLEPPAPRGPGGSPTAAGADLPRMLLSDRERAVLRLITEGLPNKQIGTALGIAERTVKSYVTSAMNKLGVDNRAHAAVAAIHTGCSNGHARIVVGKWPNRPVRCQGGKAGDILRRTIAQNVWASAAWP